MTPEEYQRFKDAEKEHLRKLRELKRAVHVLERQKKIQSTLRQMSESSTEALDAQEEAVERLARETALHEARLDVALDAASDEAGTPPLEELDEELQQERARRLVEQIRASLDAGDEPAPRESTETRRTPASPEGRPAGREAAENPTKDRTGRPEKTIGRM